MSNFSELKDQIKNWNNDTEDLLIRKLKQYTDNYLNQTEEINKNLEDLEDDYKKVEISYFNNVNLLKNLSIRKFVEHSISNDTLEFKKQNSRQEPAIILSKEEKEMSLINKFKASISISCENLNIKDLIDVKDNGNNNDDNVSVATSKYFNALKNKGGVKLPLIIGQEGFFKKPFCGIVFEDSFGDDNNNNNNTVGNNNVEDDFKNRTKSFVSTIPNNQNLGNMGLVVEQEIYSEDKFNNNNPYMNTNNLITIPQNQYNNQNIPSIPNNIPIISKVPNIPPLKNTTQVVIKVNNNSAVPSVPKISIPIPKIKPLIQESQNISQNPIIEEKKPEKLDFRAELFKRLNNKNASEPEESSNANNANVNEINNNNEAIRNKSIYNRTNTASITSSGLPNKQTQPVPRLKHSSSLYTKPALRFGKDDDDEDDEDGALFSGVKLPNMRSSNNNLNHTKNKSNFGLFNQIKEDKESDDDNRGTTLFKDIKENDYKEDNENVSKNNKLNIKDNFADNSNNKDKKLDSKLKYY